MRHSDDPFHPSDKVHALWMLLKPAIEARARELGATPLDTAIALTIGTPAYVYASVHPEHREQAMTVASALFMEVFAMMVKESN